MKRYLIYGDAHLEQEKDTDGSYILMKKVASSKRWDGIVCLGDLMDFQYISHFADATDVEGKRLSADIDILKDEIREMKKYLKKDGEFIYLAGNHEDRLEKLLRAQPMLAGLIDLKAICKEMGVEYITTQEQPYQWLDTLYLTHGLGYSKHFCAKLATEVGNNIITGHTHRTQSYTLSYPDGRTVTAYGLGSLTEMTEEYEKGKRVTCHSNSFGVVELDEETNFWQFNTIMIHDGCCILDGKMYKLM